MSIREKVQWCISEQTNLTKLVHLRDYGLDMILSNPNIPDEDFNESDKTEFISLINSRIIELGGTI